MGIEAFYWIGLAVSVVVAVAIFGFGLLWVYVNVLSNRFSAILFRTSPRRLTIAAWHESRMVVKGHDADDDWPADDWPINKRPLYLSCRIGQRRLFILAGVLSGPRYRVIHGEHPENTPKEDTPDA